MSAQFERVPLLATGRMGCTRIWGPNNCKEVVEGLGAEPQCWIGTPHDGVIVVNKSLLAHLLKPGSTCNTAGVTCCDGMFRCGISRSDLLTCRTPSVNAVGKRTASSLRRIGLCSCDLASSDRFKSFNLGDRKYFVPQRCVHVS
jgi:hypothetical protein